MVAAQIESGVFVVIERGTHPGFRGVALITNLPILPLVLVARLMTRETIGLETFFVNVIGMTVFTRQPGVNVLQLKPGVLVMVEFNLEPTAFRVAAVTLFSVIAFVDIVHLMTKKTIARCNRVTLIGMAVRARHVLVSIL